MDFDDMVLRPWSALTPERRARDLGHAAVVVEPARREHARPRHGAPAAPAPRAARRVSASTSRCSTRAAASRRLAIRDAEVRQVACRALNAFNAEVYCPYADRMTPVAQIPMHTPAEAIAELDYAVGELGLKAIMINGIVHRPIGGAAGARSTASVPELGLGLGRAPRRARPRQRVRLRPVLAALPRARRRAGVAHAGHGLGQPALDLELHVQPHRLVRREHGGDLQGAVPGRRHAALPELSLRVPRGRRRLGVRALRRPASATGRSATATRSSTSTPRASTSSSCCELFAKYGDARFRADLAGLARVVHAARARAAGARRVARARRSSAPRTSRELFVPRFYFGCEADDPIVAWAFDARANPLGRAAARDVQLRHRPLGRARHGRDPAEAHELVEDGLLARGRLPRLRVREPGALLHQREPATSSAARASRRRPRGSSPRRRQR